MFKTARIGLVTCSRVRTASNNLTGSLTQPRKHLWLTGASRYPR
jgi:hypothetical protein